MDVLAGDILEITFNSTTEGSGRFFAKAAEDSTFNLGGYRANDDENGVDGGGRLINQVNRVRWGFEVLVSWDMNDANELQKLTKLSRKSADWTISHVNGTVWGGKGVAVGAQEANGNAGTFPLKLGGGGELTKII